jgi:hypothetical protein
VFLVPLSITLHNGHLLAVAITRVVCACIHGVDQRSVTAQSAAQLSADEAEKTLQQHKIHA